MATISPLNPIQKAVLTSSCDFVAAVGRVQSGKTFVMSWMPAYSIKHNIGKGCMYLRINEQDFSIPSGFFDKFRSLYPLREQKERDNLSIKERAIGSLTTTTPAKISFDTGYTCYFKAVYDFNQKKVEALFKGIEVDKIVVDEAEDFPWDTITYVGTRVRGGESVKRTVYLVQNPERECFMRRICGCGENGGGWIGDDGKVIPEMNGKVRWFFNPDGSENMFYWGDTKEEVYAKCKKLLDAKIGDKNMDWRDAILSFVFYDLPMIDTDKTYMARTMMSSAAAAIADGNWNYSKHDKRENDIEGRELAGADVYAAFRSPRSRNFSKYFMTVDAAGTAADKTPAQESKKIRSDNMVCMLWGLNDSGLHCLDIQTWVRPHISEVTQNIKSFRNKHSLSDNQIIFDMGGIGAWLVIDFPAARKSGRTQPSNIGAKQYFKSKDEAIGVASEAIRNGVLTFEPTLRDVRYEHTRHLTSHVTICQHMVFESSALILRERKDGKKEGISKIEMKKTITQGYSLDLFDNVLMAVCEHIYDMYRLLSTKGAPSLKVEVAALTEEDINTAIYAPVAMRGKMKISSKSKMLNKILGW